MSWQFDFYKLLTTAASAGEEMRALESGLQNLVNVKRSFTSSVLKSSIWHSTRCAPRQHLRKRRWRCTHHAYHWRVREAETTSGFTNDGIANGMLGAL